MNAPSLLLYARESVAFVELGAYVAALPFWNLARRGDGHPVLVMPGLLHSDRSTWPLRRLLRKLGHDVHGWEFGINTGRSRIIEEHLLPRLQKLHADSGRKVSLVGWSMGGLFARDLARRSPDSVRQVVTLGSPFAGDAKATNAWRLYEALSGERAGDPALTQLWRDPPPVPTTSVYSRSDGIVAWQCCLNTEDARVENVEVRSTHMGFGHHPAALVVVADRLAQAEGGWRRFQPPPPLRWMFPGATSSAMPSKGEAA